MQDFISQVIQAVATGGTSAIIALLGLVIVFMWRDRERLIKENNKDDTRIDKITETHEKSAAKIVSAIHDLELRIRSNH